MVVKEDVDKPFKAGFIKEARYLKWVANVVMVKKAIGDGRSVLTTLISIKLALKIVFLY